MTASFGSIIVLIILLILVSFRFLCLVYDSHSPAGISTHCCSRRKFEENVFDSTEHFTLFTESVSINLLLCAVAFNSEWRKVIHRPRRASLPPPSARKPVDGSFILGNVRQRLGKTIRRGRLQSKVGEIKL